MRQQDRPRSRKASSRPRSSQPCRLEYDSDASARSVTDDTCSRVADDSERPVHAPDPTAAHQRRFSAGADTTPTTGRSRSSSATRVAHTGTPRTKFFVPSMGSTTQTRWP